MTHLLHLTHETEQDRPHGERMAAGTRRRHRSRPASFAVARRCCAPTHAGTKDGDEVNSMMTIAGAAMGAATRIYCDELDGMLDRHFPHHSVRVSEPETLYPWDEDYPRDYWPLVSSIHPDLTTEE